MSTAGNLTAFGRNIFQVEENADFLGSFLRELFFRFEREGIEYALARDYGPFPESIAGRDVDLLVDSEQLESAYRALKSVAQIHSANVLRVNQESAIWLLVFQADLSWGLRVDLATTESHTWRGVRHLNLDRIFRRRVWESGAVRLQPNDIVFMQFCRDLTGSLDLRKKYHSAIRRIYREDPADFRAQLTDIFGCRLAAALTEVCREGNFKELRVLGKRMRRAIILRGLVRNPMRTSRDILHYILWRCGEYMRPNGVVVAVIGPDGSGKGTLIQALSRFISGPIDFPTRIYHWRPGFLPSLGSVFLGRKDDDIPVTDPHAKQPHGSIISLLRLAYYSLDYALGYWLRIRPYLGRKCLVTIFDRYFYDYLIDPLRFRISLPQWMVRVFGVLVPKPNLVILLSADPEAIHRRKPELPVSEINRQVSEMVTLANYMGNSVWIDSSGPVEDSSRKMIQAVLGILEERLA